MLRSECHTFVYVGCYTTERRKARGKGLKVYSIDTDSGEWDQIQEIPADLSVNPSFLAFDKNKRFLYVAHGDHTEVSAYSIDPNTGKLDFINKKPSGGYNGAHICVSKTMPFLFISNIFSGTVASIEINEDGSIGALADIYVPPGPVGHLSRQHSANPHEVVEDPKGNFIHVADLGKDRVYHLSVDSGTGKLTELGSLDIQPAMCSRHLDFTPDSRHVYILAEHAGSIIACKYNEKTGIMAPVQMLSSLPDDFVGAYNDAAEIAVHPSGRFVYLSNRGPGNIGAYKIDNDSGKLSPVGWYSTNGLSPRYFCIEPGGNYLVAGNEQSDTIVLMKINQNTGELSLLPRVISTPSPSCILLSGPITEV
jgi:6-phosphogluconolactonase (cycloisomerase 2 family)